MKLKYEMLQLRRPPNRLTSAEYALYGLEKKSWEQKSQFLGALSATAVNSCNDLKSHVLAKDKLVAYSILGFHNFPFPKVRAVVHPSRDFPGAVSLRSPQQLASYLQSQAEFPVFMKPIAGNAGGGSVWINACLDEKLHLRDGKEIPIDAYCNKWLSMGGVLLQSAAHPHPDIAARIGQRLATARLVVLVTDDGPILHRAVLRIPAGSNMIDNFQHGASGNLLAHVESDTGLISRVIGKRQYGLELISEHPDTGEKIVGWVVPDWQKAKELCLQAAPLFPGISYQSWDIAFTDQGPQTMEVNAGGDVDVLQLASGVGIADEIWWKTLREPAPSNLVRSILMRNGPWNRA